MQKLKRQPAKQLGSGSSFFFAEDSSLVSPHLRSFKPYQPGRPPEQLRKDLGIDQLINLASNENPLGVSPAVSAAVVQAVPELSRYPEAAALRLRQALADRHGTAAQNIAVGNGSESVMACIIRAFLHGSDEALTSQGTFVDFALKVQAHGTKLVQVPLRDYRFDLTALSAAVNERTKIVYLCNPNNPTGTVFSKSEFDEFMSEIPENVLVILDEAYREFTDETPEFSESFSCGYDNVIVLRTFSKAYGMAGIRLGYAVAHEYLVDFVNKVRLIFEPSSLALAAGLAALQDADFLARTLANNRAGKQFLTDAFVEMGLTAIPTQSNFIMLDLGSAELVAFVHENLLRKGIAIRPLGGFGLPHCIRVTIGAVSENAQLISALKQVIADCSLK